jgi:class 3 adenylate cyclase
MTTRRLAAILAADVVGFSSMMERDEEGDARSASGPHLNDLLSVPDQPT